MIELLELARRFADGEISEREFDRLAMELLYGERKDAP